MSKWKFPDDRPFHITDKDGTWCNCQLVEEDAETVTFDYDAANNGARMRVQLSTEDIRSVSSGLDVFNEMLAAGHRRHEKMITDGPR